jgi:hypothetical protein
MPKTKEFILNESGSFGVDVLQGSRTQHRISAPADSERSEESASLLSSPLLSLSEIISVVLAKNGQFCPDRGE